MTTISKLFNGNHGFGKQDGWEYRIWSSYFDDPKNPSELIYHSIPYIIHKDKGFVVTSQAKAWNDNFRMHMYLDLILERYKMFNGYNKFCLWMDNFSAHGTPTVVNP
jgi:hypothetical protein